MKILHFYSFVRGKNGHGHFPCSNRITFIVVKKLKPAIHIASKHFVSGIRINFCGRRAPDSISTAAVSVLDCYTVFVFITCFLFYQTFTECAKSNVTPNKDDDSRV